MELQYCSVADVTFEIEATQQGAWQYYGPSIWYGGDWMLVRGNTRRMMFKVVYVGEAPGLYYWGVDYTLGVPSPPTAIGDGILVKSFTDGVLTATLRFQTSTAGVATASCDGTPVETFSDLSGTVELEDLVSRLWCWDEGGDDETPGAETMRLGRLQATVWQALGFKVIVDDGAPAIVAEVAHDWPAWVEYVQTEDSSSLFYRVTGDLFTDFAGDWHQLQVDGSGRVYTKTSEAYPYLASLQFHFRYYVTGSPNLSIAHHPVSNTLLVADAGLGAAPGYHKVQRKADDYEWSARIPVAVEGETAIEWTNIVAIGQRLDLMLSTAVASKVAAMASLDGEWQSAKQLALEKAGFALSAGQRYFHTTVNEGTARLTVREQGGDYGVVDSAVAIRASDAVPPVLAMHPTLQRLFAAVQWQLNTRLLVSDDRGATWTEARTITGLRYPNLFVDGMKVWVVGYVAGTYEGAQGTVRVSAFEATKAMTELVAQQIVGPSDAGRPAIVKRPVTGEMIAVAAKVGAAWTAVPGMSGKGVAEYRSVDSGGSWVMKAIHGVT